MAILGLCQKDQYEMTTYHLFVMNREMMAAKRTDVLSMLSYFVIFFACFYVLKARHLTSDGISITLDLLTTMKISFIYSSMQVFCQQNQRFKKIVSYNHQRINLFTTLQLLCGDIETCPGPSNLSDLCNCRGMKFVHQNIRGLTNSFPSLEAFVYKEGSKIDDFQKHIELKGTRVSMLVCLNLMDIH